MKNSALMLSFILVLFLSLIANARDALKILHINDTDSSLNALRPASETLEDGNKFDLQPSNLQIKLKTAFSEGVGGLSNLLWKSCELDTVSIFDIETDVLGNIYVCGYLGQGIFKSNDQGKTWKNVNAGLKSLHVFSLTFIDTPSPIIYAGTSDSGLFKSSNMGETWVSDDLSQWVSSISQNSAGDLFAATMTDGIYCKYKNGNWQKVSDEYVGMDVYSLFINELDDIIVGTDCRILKSTDNGNSWIEKLNAIGVIWDITSSSYGDIYACDGGGFWAGEGRVCYSADFGENWSILSMTNRSANAIIIVPPQNIYVATDSGVFISYDNGLTAERNYIGSGSLNVYKIKIDNSGYIYAGTSKGIYRSLSTVSAIKLNETAPLNFYLSQNYPNPFNPETNFEFTIPESGLVTLKIYDVLGKEAAVVVNAQLSAGTYKFNWTANGGANRLASGVYLYQLKVGNFLETKKLILLR